MISTHSDDVKKTSMRPLNTNDISAAEWAVRTELAACYRIFAHLGWVELIYNHITVRVPGEQKHFLINPFGLRYDEVTASNLVKIDLHGNVIGHSEWPVNPAGFTVHRAIHESLEHAHCVMHTHTTAGMAVACSQDGLLPKPGLIRPGSGEALAICTTHPITCAAGISRDNTPSGSIERRRVP